jgi:hypothetical protein
MAHTVNMNWCDLLEAGRLATHQSLVKDRASWTVSVVLSMPVFVLL